MRNARRLATIVSPLFGTWTQAANGRNGDNFMKIVAWETLIDNNFSTTAAFNVVQTHIRDAISLIRWPPGNSVFAIRPESGKKRGEGNGVAPIKKAFIAHLQSVGWTLEKSRFDAHYTFSDGSSLPFVVEWETGNISSSHRSINRIALGMLQGEVSGGVVVVPSQELRPYLTDRIGNVTELIPYYPLWQVWEQFSMFGYLAVVAVEHDVTSMNVPRIPKRTDGRARN
jgi:hypothetical protein